MAKENLHPYFPNIVPTNLEDIPRFLNEELERIRQALVAQPVACSVEEDGTVVIGPTVNWQTVFIGVTPSWEAPGGDFDPATGAWTCSQYGLYSMSLQMEVAPFGAGNKDYYAGVAIIRDRGGALTRWESTDGTADNIPLGVTLSGLLPAEKGDVFHCEATAVHENQTGTVDISIGWQILSVSK